jgi:hypothetical protein
METNFKVGDRVYDIVWGWGVVTSDMGINNIEIKFDSNIYQTFRKDGRYADSSKPTLSFTEYTLQGYTQKKPIVLPEVGELCLMRDSDDEDWKAFMFKEYNSSYLFPFITKRGFAFKQMKRIKILD